MQFFDIKEGTSHAGYSETLSRLAGFDVYISNVTFNKTGNKSIIEFEGDGFIQVWEGFSNIMVNGVRYIDKTTDTVYSGIKDGNDVFFSSVVQNSPSIPIEVVNATSHSVTHTGNYPVVQTINSDGIQTEATVQHTSPTSFTVTWSSPFTGKVIFTTS